MRDIKPRAKIASSVKKRVWRISADAPFGKFVDAEASQVEPPPASLRDPDEPRFSGWAVSSFELKYGLDVTELPIDTLQDRSTDTAAPDASAPDTPIDGRKFSEE